MKAFGALALSALLGIPLAAWRAYVAIVLWGWFVQPATGWPAPGLWTVAGVFVLVSLAHNPGVKTKADDYGTDYTGMIIYGVVLSLLVPAFALLSGFIFKTIGG